MTKAGARMAVRLADLYLQKSPLEISKAFGARESVAEGFSVYGEFLAKVAAEKQATITAKAKLIRQTKRQLALADQALEMFARAQDADNLSLAKVTAYAIPSESELEARVNLMISRQRVVDHTPKVIARIDDVLSSGLNLCQDEHMERPGGAALPVPRNGAARDRKAHPSRRTYTR